MLTQSCIPQVQKLFSLPHVIPDLSYITQMTLTTNFVVMGTWCAMGSSSTTFDPPFSHQFACPTNNHGSFRDPNRSFNLNFKFGPSNKKQWGQSIGQIIMWCPNIVCILFFDSSYTSWPSPPWPQPPWPWPTWQAGGGATQTGWPGGHPWRRDEQEAPHGHDTATMITGGHQLLSGAPHSHDDDRGGHHTTTRTSGGGS